MRWDKKLGAYVKITPTTGPIPGPKLADVQWPKPLKPEAYYGLAGEIVRTIEPHSEADPSAILLHLLIGLGSAIGRGPHARGGSDRHHLNLFGAAVGKTSKGRKGSSWGPVHDLLAAVDPEWAENRIQSGLASGEGLIWAVRDPIEKQQAIRGKDKTITGYENVIEDPGVTDKRLLVIESEFARVLQVSQRDSNILSAVIRQCWDSGMLRTLTRSSPAKATGCHVSIIGHITRDELLKCLTTNEAGNGFANRFLWVCSQRTRLLPEGGELHKVDMGPIIRKLIGVVQFARTAGELHRDDNARELWADVYGQLSGDRPGLYGAVTSRGEAQTLRLSCLYALLDKSAKVRFDHLAAALEFWRYCDESARFIFGDSLGDPTADMIMRALRKSIDGLSREQISVTVFARNKPAAEITRALSVLADRGVARSETRETNGRPAEFWIAIGA